MTSVHVCSQRPLKQPSMLGKTTASDNSWAWHASLCFVLHRKPSVFSKHSLSVHFWSFESDTQRGEQTSTLFFQVLEAEKKPLSALSEVHSYPLSGVERLLQALAGKRSPIQKSPFNSWLKMSSVFLSVSRWNVTSSPFLSWHPSLAVLKSTLS